MDGLATYLLKTLFRAALVGWGYSCGYVDGSSLVFIFTTDLLRLAARSDWIVENCAGFLHDVAWRLFILPINIFSYLGVQIFSFYMAIFYGLIYFIPKGRTETTDLFLGISLAMSSVIAWVFEYILPFAMVFICFTDLVEIAQYYLLPGLRSKSFTERSRRGIDTSHATRRSTERNPYVYQQNNYDTPRKSFNIHSSFAIFAKPNSSTVIIILVLPAMTWLFDIDAIYLWVFVGAGLTFLATRAAVGRRIGRGRCGANEKVSREFYNTLLQHWWSFSNGSLTSFLRRSLSDNMEVISFTSTGAPSLSISSIRVFPLSATQVAVGAHISFKLEDFHLVTRKFLSDYTFRNVRLEGDVQILLSYSLGTSFPHISNVNIRFTDISQFDFTPQVTGFQYLLGPIPEILARQYLIDLLKNGIVLPVGQPRRQDCRVS